MADPIGMLHDLVRRVTALETNRGRLQTSSRRARPLDADSAAILRYLQTSQTKAADDRDVAAVRDWLTSRKQKA